MRMRDDVFVFWIRAEKWDTLQDVIREACYELELDEILEDVPPDAADERYTLLRPFVSGKISSFSTAAITLFGHFGFSVSVFRHS